MTRALAMPSNQNQSQPNHTTAALRVGLPARLRFVIWRFGGVIELPAYKEIIVGRATSTSDVDIDLTVFNAQNMGISRQHLQIMSHGCRMMVKDLYSANGSKINDEEMTPGYVYDLEHGDRLTLGKMHIQVFFNTPGHTSKM